MHPGDCATRRCPPGRRNAFGQIPVRRVRGPVGDELWAEQVPGILDFESAVDRGDLLALTLPTLAR